jgi:arylsulfatase A-like enzyme
VFREAGYVTGAIGKVHVRGETRERDLGFDERAMRLYTYWFEDYIEAAGEDAADTYAMYRKPLERYQTVYNLTNRGIALEEPRMFDALVVDRCVDFMSRHREHPFFLWAGIEKPHPDWYAPEEFHRMYDPRTVDMPSTVQEERSDMPEAWYVSTRQAFCFTEDEMRCAIAAYYANVTYMDAKIGQLLDALQRLGLAENTIVVYATDHGEMLFEHGMVQKCNFFEGSARVPLIVRGPGGVRRNAVCEGLVSLLDLFPTFCELAGINAPSGLEGTSLTDTLQGTADGDADRAVFSEFYEYGIPERMIRHGDWKYTYAQNDVCQLYNLREDPREELNLVDTPGCADARSELHRRLMAGWEVPDMAQLQFGGPWNDPAEYRRMRAEARQRGR